MIHLNKKNEPEYHFSSDKIINIADLFDSESFKSSLLDNYPNLVKESVSKSIISFKYENTYEFTTFACPKNFYIEGRNISGKLYSLAHLQKIIDTYNIRNPAYRTDSDKELKPLKNIELLTSIAKISSQMFIVDNDIFVNHKKFINEMKNIYKEEFDQFKKQYSLKYISPNFKKYFPKNDIEKISDETEIQIFMTQDRLNIFDDIDEFLKSTNKEKIYALCGPFGIGKSFSSLLIKKYIYKEKKKIFIYKFIK